MGVTFGGEALSGVGIPLAVMAEDGTVIGEVTSGIWSPLMLGCRSMKLSAFAGLARLCAIREMSRMCVQVVMHAGEAHQTSRQSSGWTKQQAGWTARPCTARCQRLRA